jgi:NAD(P)H-hydrate epimerase
MKIVTAAEMREIDQAAGSTYGVPEVVLMENAGVQAAHETKRLLQGVEDKAIVIFCGSGNNGGDGFVAARHLANLGAKVKVFLLGDLQQLSEAAQMNLDIITNMDLDIRQVASPRDWDKIQVVLAFVDGIVDALLGTGFHGVLSEDLERLISMINEAEKPVLAIDMPSGVAADSGCIAQTAVAASATVTFGLPKLGQIFYPGGAYTGNLLVDGIGIPRALLEAEEIQQALLDIHLVKKLLVPRAADVHKNSCGRVLEIGRAHV